MNYPAASGGELYPMRLNLLDIQDAFPYPQLAQKQLLINHKDEAMKQVKKTLLLSLAVVFIVSALAYAQGFEYEVNKPHKGKDATPIVAYIMLLKDPGHSFLVDVRTQPEYQFLGHPERAYNIPVRFWSGKLGEKDYIEVDNPDFGKDLLARFNPKTDTLFFMCRSGSRSVVAADEAVKAGWPEDKVFSIMGGFEGDKITFKKSAYYGQRKLGGWRNEGLPWTYDIDKKLVYQRDLTQ
jgi:rhodanese-related sulfurtransferase